MTVTYIHTSEEWETLMRAIGERPTGLSDPCGKVNP